MKKRILFVLHYPPPIHGSSVVGLQIKESKIINDYYDCSYVNLSTSKTIDEIGNIGFRKIVIYFKILYQAVTNYISFKPHLTYMAITAKGVAFYKDTLIVILLKLLGGKFIFHMHNKGVNTRQHLFFDNLLYKLVFNNSEVIMLSKFLYPDIKKYVPRDRVHYCPNGIPENPKEERKKVKNKSDMVELLFLSNLIESKGVFILLEACKILQNKRFNFKCTFIGGEGDVDEKQFNEKAKELNIKECVIYDGKKYGKDKKDAFIKADIFVLPTYYHNECFPLVLLEAMQHCLPVVSTFEGGIPDVVEDGITGFLVPQQNAQALADKLERLIKNPELRKQMGEAGQKKYMQEFKLEIFENRLKTILKTSLRNN